ncbi:GNAT family N-acetyltransferase [Sulfurimonas sp. HSL-1716]|uniref:GNAT family N-acetyltransferase n=1 Tax=Hydrocurvibacter sulfurireducens TaxID=3131937 RepID=UPI0031F8D932
MTLKGFDIALTPLEHKDIETVRFWRNSDEVKRYALDQSHITQEQQEAWFASLAKKEDEYFVIRVKEKPIGLIWFNKRGESVETGFYLYDASKQNSLVPYKIVTLFHDYLFNEKDYRILRCKIMHDNPRAIRFNLSLGYKEKEEHELYKSYELAYEDYKRADAKISKLLLREKE